MKRMLCMLACAALCTQIAAAQTLFRTSLDGTQEVPPNNSTATAWATFVLNPDNTLTYFVNNQGLSAVAAHIHEGPPGVSGPIIFPLSGGPDIYSGSRSEERRVGKGRRTRRHKR